MYTISNSIMTFNGSTTFNNNSAMSGGGLYALGKNVHFSGKTIFSNNSANGDGGGVFVSCSVSITGHAIFYNNSALVMVGESAHGSSVI